MKKLVKLMAVAVLAASSVGAITLEEYNELIPKVNNLPQKQILICMREKDYISSNPMECIKAAQISLKEYESTEARGVYNSYQEYVTDMYFTAGVIYNKIRDYANEIKMYKKALGLLPNHIETHVNLGVTYYSGKGVETNKIKAYEHFSIAAKQGNQQAQKNLDILCGQSPWACK